MIGYGTIRLFVEGLRSDSLYLLPGIRVSQVLSGCLIILGIATRPAALVLAFTMVVAWLMVGTGKTWLLDKTGAWAIENLMYFFIGALAVACLGAGRYAFGKGAWR